MIRLPQANRLAFRLHQPFRHITRCLQYKSEGSGGGMTQQSVGGIVHPGIGAQLRQVAAHQREIVIFPQGTDPPDTFHGFFIPQLTAQRIG